jgi:hypothetical protein
MPTAAEINLTLAELQKKAPGVDAYALERGSVLLLVFDTNMASFASVRELSKRLKDYGVESFAIGYNGLVTDSPLNIFEVKNANRT